MVTMTRAKFPMLTTANTFLRIGPTQRVRAIGLALAGLLSLAIYMYAFVQPYHLARWWSYPQRTIAKITGYDQSVGILYVLAMAALFVLYGYACRAAQGRHPALTWAIVFLGMVAFNAAMLQLYPVDSNDIFDYIIRARMTAHYGANPFYRVPAEFPTDPFQAYNGWDRIPSAYGPLWELIAAAGAWIGGNAATYRDTLIGNVLVFKRIAVLGYAGTALVIGLILRRHAPERALVGVVLFAWNPLVIYAFTAGNGHNDAVMAFFLVLGCYWLLRRRFTLAALAQTAGALVKFVSILLVPIVPVYYRGARHKRP
jgi:alpha-1,6-mannosyltransferase